MAGGLFKDIRSGVAGNFVWDVLKLIVQAILTLTAASGGATALTNVVTQLQPHKWYLAVSVTCLIFLFLISRYRKKYNRYLPVYPPLEFDFEVVELEILYEHHEQNRMTYSKRKKLRALRNGLDRYRDKYLWTGKGDESIDIKDKSQKVSKTQRINVWQYYEIQFPHTLNEGDEIDTCPVWTLLDKENLAVPFMSATIEEPTKHLSLVLKLADELEITSATKQVSPGIGAQKPFRSDPAELKGNTVTYDVPDPKLLYHYELKWQWK